jgi:hypothetical protein
MAGMRGRAKANWVGVCLAGAVAAALELGATLGGVQPQEDCTVLLDPAGHPFCLYLDT